MNPSLTKDWALCLEAIFRNEKPPESCLIYEPLAWAQEAVTSTNLTLMQAVAIGGVLKAHKQFQAMHRNGYWTEGYCYAKYARMAPEWYQKSHNGAGLDILDGFDEILFNYSRLAFPDGSLPLPEVSADVRLPFDPLTAEDDYEDDSYRVHRWFNADHTECIAQLLICLDTSPEPRANLHYHLSAGYAALWMKGQEVDTGKGFTRWINEGWQMRCKAYTGFDAIRNAESADVAFCLPKGGLSPAWRLNPPEVYSGMEPGGYWFDWLDPLSNFTSSIASRRITWDAQRVTVCDNGITRTWEIKGE